MEIPFFLLTVIAKSNNQRGQSTTNTDSNDANKFMIVGKKGGIPVKKLSFTWLFFVFPGGFL
jgi:hypothetical protein